MTRWGMTAWDMTPYAMAGWLASLRRAMQSILDCAFPVSCIGCGELDTLICARCDDCCTETVSFDCSGTLTGVGWACGAYTTALRRIILAWKDHGAQACTPFLASCLRTLTTNICSQLEQKGIAHFQLAIDTPILVIAVPSSSRSVHKRGRKHMLPLASAVAQQLCDCGIPARAVPLLKMRYTRTKSVQTAGRVSRQQRLAERALYIHDAQKYKGALCILVDDIVTTGSTMRHCITELYKQHISTVMVLCLAKT